MKFIYSYSKIIKNGFFLDYFVKNISLILYKNLLINYNIYILDKYFSEKII